MTASTTAKIFLVAATLLLAGGGRTDDDVSFFDDDQLTFERERTAKTQEQVEPREPTPSPHDEPLPRKRLTAVVSRAPSTKSPPPPSTLPPPVQPPVRTPSGAPIPATMSGAEGRYEVQVLKVRELTAEERARLGGWLRCTKPLAVELRPDPRLTALMKSDLHLSGDFRPETIPWTTSREGACFDWHQFPYGERFHSVDDAIRRALQGKGKR
jgi:hypothetical protein